MSTDKLISETQHSTHPQNETTTILVIEIVHELHESSISYYLHSSDYVVHLQNVYSRISKHFHYMNLMI